MIPTANISIELFGTMMFLGVKFFIQLPLNLRIYKIMIKLNAKLGHVITFLETWPSRRGEL